MSFSNEVRNEVARYIPDKPCCRKSELASLLLFAGQVEKTANGQLLKITVENAATARKIYQYVKEFSPWPATVESEAKNRFRKSRAYDVVIEPKDSDKEVLEEMGLLYPTARRHAPWNLLGKSCCRRSFIRGLFLTRGFINRPEGNYHLELVLGDTRLAAEVQKLLQKMGLKAGCIERKNHLVVYLKDSEKIADFLRLIGASKALLDFENARILKSMRNTVNRQVNCETANLVKTIDASVRQVELMEKLIQSQRWEMLSPQLKELAMVRLKYPDSTLKELGEMLNPPLSKSGAAYRMRKLEQTAEELLDQN
ncbi:MAG: DNA-binding protein WhiA [Syntrophomonas sp.]